MELGKPLEVSRSRLSGQVGLHEGDQAGEVALVGVLHGLDVVCANGFALRQAMNLRPLGQGVLARVEENICDEAGMASVAVSERMNFREPILQSCGDFERRHGGVEGVP